MFRWTEKFIIGATELIKESSHFPKHVIIVNLVWLVHIVTKMKEFQYVKKPVTFHRVGVKNCTAVDQQLFSVSVTYPICIIVFKKTYISCTVTSGSCGHLSSLSSVSKY